MSRPVFRLTRIVAGQYRYGRHYLWQEGESDGNRNDVGKWFFQVLNASVSEPYRTKREAVTAMRDALGL